jgi:hypothetical protein
LLTNIDIDMFLEGAEIDAEDQEQAGDDGQYVSDF